MHASFLDALRSERPAADRAEKMMLYGRFVGSWEMKSVVHDENGGRQQGPDGEIHFEWALLGRAIIDVWILPDVFYGSTLRVYDPALDAWQILWSDPLRVSLVVLRATTSCRSATTARVRRCAGASARSRSGRSTGPASDRRTAVRAGRSRSSSSPGAWLRRAGGSSSRNSRRSPGDGGFRCRADTTHRRCPTTASPASGTTRAPKRLHLRDSPRVRRRA